MKTASFSFLLLMLAVGNISLVNADDKLNQCLLTQLATADDTVSVGDIKQLCDSKITQNTIEEASPNPNPIDIKVTSSGVETEDKSAITRRLFLEKKEAKNPFVLLPHKPNYIILSNNMASPNETPFEAAYPGDNIHLQPWETKFQISLKLPVAYDLFNGRADAYVAYTNRSFWQQFNKHSSSPFRESDHEPEAWLSFKTNYEIFGIKNSLIRTGVVHQSNGQAGELSRSWNRVYADFVFEHNDWYYSLKPWWRIPDSSSDDDNPDIEEYMGNFEFGAVYKMDNHSFDILLRNNLNFDDNYGAVQLGWSFPLTDRVKGYVQWFNGYGESLIDYDTHSNSIGFGIQLSDWL